VKDRSIIARMYTLKRLRWFGHVQCMENSSRARQVLYWIPAEKRKRGRPRVTEWRISARWMRRGMKSTKQQRRDMSGEYEPPNVTGRTWR